MSDVARAYSAINFATRVFSSSSVSVVGFDCSWTKTATAQRKSTSYQTLLSVRKHKARAHRQRTTERTRTACALTPVRIRKRRMKDFALLEGAYGPQSTKSRAAHSKKITKANQHAHHTTPQSNAVKIKKRSPPVRSRIRRTGSSTKTEDTCSENHKKCCRRVQTRRTPHKQQSDEADLCA